mmetsp:Transcript_48164/g.113196  ORF Transcript_48164/g.113196 Transcript_48164/m.113196 type:complete len:145 (-) Transcript_48164:49-483(-)
MVRYTRTLHRGDRQSLVVVIGDSLPIREQVADQVSEFSEVLVADNEQEEHMEELLPLANKHFMHAETDMLEMNWREAPSLDDGGWGGEALAGTMVEWFLMTLAHDCVIPSMSSFSYTACALSQRGLPLTCHQEDCVRDIILYWH